MSAPTKPWEGVGPGDSRTFQMPAAADQNLIGQISGNNASQPTALLGPTPTVNQPRRRPPAAPVNATNPRTQVYNTAPGMQGAYGTTYPSTYSPYAANSYGSTYGSALGGYGSTYGSALGSYGLGTYGSSYGSTYGSPYGGYGMGSGYGSYGQRFGGFGSPQFGPTAESRLVALASERSRPAFESIESVVQTVGSVSFMLESTLGALHSSFRAVLAVADHLGRLRAIFSAMAIFRLARTLYMKLMQMIGIAGPQRAEAAWAAAGPEPSPGGSWPVAAFVAVVVAAPYLAFRLLQRLAPPEPGQPTQVGGVNELPTWLSSGQPVQRATLRYDFVPEAPGELPVRANQAVFLAPQRMQTLHDGWLLASDGNSSGLVPRSYFNVPQAPPRQNASNSPVLAEPSISPGKQDYKPEKTE